MNKTLTCIICPRGCTLQVDNSDNAVKITGNACKRGEQYGIAEFTHPTRTVTSIVRVSNREDTMLCVKTKDPIPKENIFDLLEILKQKEIEAPVEIGDVICNNVFGTDVIATKNIK